MRAVNTLTGANVSCDAWWDETSCVLPIDATGLQVGELYDIDVYARQLYSAPPVVVESAGSYVDGDDSLAGDQPVLVTVGSGSAPVQTPDTADERTPDPIVDLSTVSPATVDVLVQGYVSVPQGHVRLDATFPVDKKLVMTGGLVAAKIRFDSGSEPESLDVRFDNPISQKRVRIRSISYGDYRATSDAVIQVNRSGSIAINSWIIQ